MRYKKHKCDIYPFDLIVIDGIDKEVEKKFGITGFNNIGGTWYSNTEYNKNVYVIINTKNKGIEYPLQTIVHESAHAANVIFSLIGHAWTYESDEPYCYLIDWIAGKCFDFFIEKYKLKK